MSAATTAAAAAAPAAVPIDLRRPSTIADGTTSAVQAGMKKEKSTMMAMMMTDMVIAGLQGSTFGFMGP